MAGLATAAMEESFRNVLLVLSDWIIRIVLVWQGVWNYGRSPGGLSRIPQAEKDADCSMSKVAARASLFQQPGSIEPREANVAALFLR